MYVFEKIANTVMPYRDNLIISLETAADFLNLSNGGLYKSDIQAYSPIEQNIPGFIITVQPDCFKIKQYEERHGIFSTTPEQTLLDLLENEEDIDIQTLLESLSNYYYKHHESFNGLEDQMNSKQQQAFEKWKQDAIDYYTED